MKVQVNKDLCIGCGACQAVAPDIFEIEDDGLAHAINSDVQDSQKDDALDALEGCPTSAIEEISE